MMRLKTLYSVPNMIAKRRAPSIDDIRTFLPIPKDSNEKYGGLSSENNHYHVRLI